MILSVNSMHTVMKITKQVADMEDVTMVPTIEGEGKGIKLFVHLGTLVILKFCRLGPLRYQS